MDFALKSKLRPGGFLLHRPIFAGNSRFTGISQLRAGKTRSKRPRSHWLSTVHLLPYMWASFYPLDPSRYLSSFSRWRPKTDIGVHSTISDFFGVQSKILCALTKCSTNRRQISMIWEFLRLCLPCKQVGKLVILNAFKYIKNVLEI